MPIAKRTSVFAFGVPLLFVAASLSSSAQDEPFRSKVHGILANDFQAPISFEPNQGQADSHVKFVARGSGYNLFLTPSNALLLLARNRASNDLATTNGDVVTMNVVGANPTPKITGRDELPAKSSYFLGSNPSHWHTNIPNFGRVEYENVYPGIDLVYHGTQGQLEYDFVLHPGASTNSIVIEFIGAKNVRIDRRGELVVETAHGEICFHKPAAYQGEPGNRRVVAARYRSIRTHRVGFAVDAYDPSRTLVIDPLLAVEPRKRLETPKEREISVPLASAACPKYVGPRGQKSSAVK